MLKGTKNISSVYAGSKPISSIYKGDLLVYSAGYILEKLGYPLTLTDCLNKDLLNYQIYGKSLRDGTPTPDTPIPVLSLSENSKNLFSISDIKMGSNITDLTLKDDRFTYVATSSGTSGQCSKSILLPAGTYTFSGNKYTTYTGTVSSGENVCVYVSTTNSSAGSIIDEQTRKVNFSLTFTLDEETLIYFVFSKPYRSNVGDILSIVEPQLELGTTKTNYKPYHYIDFKVNNNVTTLNLGNHEPLRKVSSYSDYIDYESQQIVRNIKKKKLTVSLVTYGSRDNVYGFRMSDFASGGKRDGTYNMSNICDSFITINGDSVSSNDKEGIALRQDSLYLFLDKSRISSFDTTEASEYVNSLGAYVYYILDEPTYEDIELPNITLEKGTNELTAYDELIESSNISVKYRSKSNL